MKRVLLVTALVAAVLPAPAQARSTSVHLDVYLVAAPVGYGFAVTATCVLYGVPNGSDVPISAFVQCTADDVIWSGLGGPPVVAMTQEDASHAPISACGEGSVTFRRTDATTYDVPIGSVCSRPAATQGQPVVDHQQADA
jgi:hypothetical protein